MRHTPLTPQFYVTAPQPCPYLEGRMERKLFTALEGDDGAQINDSLSRQGFRRSQNVIYRPTCADCAACMSARIKVAEFKPSRSQRRILKRNTDLLRRPATAWATDPQYELFRRYLDARHATGGMADMDVFEFAAMVEETPVRTRMVEYYNTDEAGNVTGLAAVCLTDMLDDGLSMVYSFFDPDLEARSLGSFMILDHIELAREMEYDYVYLGYWVPGSPKMGYKMQYGPLQVYTEGRWQDLDDPDAIAAKVSPLGADPIAEQVARISLKKGAQQEG